MDGGVFLLQGDDTLIRMIERPYEAESLLQALLATHPDLLAGDQIDAASPRRWLLIEREAGVPARSDGADWWAVDHLFLDQDATPTFVEVKRAADTRARREVVAQMLDYAANATEYWPVDRMRELFALRCASRGIDAGDELEAFVGPEGDEERFWALAKSNLRSGRIRLLFVADRIPPSLRRIVEFLNQHMNPVEVLAVEIRQFSAGPDAPLRTLVPRVIGQTEQTREAKSAPSSPRQSTRITRDEWIARLRIDTRDLALAILGAAEAHGFIAADYRRSSSSSWARITLTGVPGTPVTLNEEFLWVSLGRHHPALLEPAANQRIRRAILRVAPSRTQAEDPNKSEVGIPLASIGVDGRDQVPALFEVLKTALVESSI
jgi:hypothetical protein